MSKFDDTEWKIKIINMMSKDRVFRSGAIVEAGEALGVKKRSIDYLISDLVEESRIIPAQRGLYFINHPGMPVSPPEIAAALNPNIYVSMESSFRNPTPTGRELTTMHLVSEDGRVGQFKSPLGPIAIHRISPELCSALLSNLGKKTALNKSPYGHSKIRVFNPTIALLHICNGNALARRGSTYGEELPPNYADRVDASLLQKLADDLRITIPDNIYSAIERDCTDSPSPFS